MTDWRKIQIPDPDGDCGYLLVPPDDTPARGPIWSDERFVDHLVYCLNLERTVAEVGMAIPVPEPEHFDIVFTPARKRANSPRRATK